jgi:hypothetical protein
VRPRVIVHSPGHAAAALAAAASLGIPISLESAPGAGGYAGPRWFLAMIAQAAPAHGEADFTAIVDCADEAGTALAALRAGAKRVRFTGSEEARTKLADIAASLGAAIEGQAQAPALDLLDARDPLALAKAYLQDCAGTSGAPHR